MNPISGIQQSQQQLSAMAAAATTGQADTVGGSFKDLLFDSIDQVNSMQQQADRAVEDLFTGGDVNPAEVLTAVQKADLAFRLLMQTRNKLVQAYREIENLQI